jgi:hypothetical protein
MHLKCWPFWAGLGLLAALAVPAAGQEPGTTQSLEALRARCPTTRNLAPAAFVREEAVTAAQMDEWQQRIRGPLRAEAPPPDAALVLRAFAGASMTQSSPSETATTLWRLPDGSWHFVEANYYPRREIIPELRPATLTAEQVERAKHEISGGRLDQGQARALDALLGDPCLEAEPSVVTGFLALPLGMRPEQPCYDAVLHTVEVVRAGRRRAYAQTCLKFLAGELIMVALYPRAEGEVPATPSDRTLASLESARLYADEALRAGHGGDAWVNATEAAGAYAFMHRESGFRCAATRPSEIEVFGPNPNALANRGRCYRNSFLRVREGNFLTEWQVAMPRAPSDVREHVRAAAHAWFSSYYGSSADPDIRVGTVTLGGLLMVRAEVAGVPHVDARDDELTVVLGAEHDGWLLVARATGGASDPAAVEAAALREWRNAVETRARPVR